MGQGNFQTPNSHVDGEDSAKTMVYHRKRNSKKRTRKGKSRRKKERSKKYNSNKKEL